MKTILIGAAVVWCIGFVVIVALSIRKHQRRKFEQAEIRRIFGDYEVKS